MKLTTKHGTYAKRIKSFSLSLMFYLDATEQMTRDLVSDLAPIVRYFKSKEIYITRATDKLVADRNFDGCTCAVKIETYLEDNAVCCNDKFITLMFPSIEEVLHSESFTVSNRV